MKSVYDVVKHESSRPGTVPNLMNITEGTKYEDEQLRESVVNIDKSEDSEFLKAQIRMRHNRDNKRGWSSKYPRRQEDNLSLRNSRPVRIKKQPAKKLKIEVSMTPTNMMSADSR
jgi:hypothetical protein